MIKNNRTTMAVHNLNSVNGLLHKKKINFFFLNRGRVAFSQIAIWRNAYSLLNKLY